MPKISDKENYLDTQNFERRKSYFMLQKIPNDFCSECSREKENFSLENAFIEVVFSGYTGLCFVKQLQRHRILYHALIKFGVI
jgi:hypothetical protein